MRHLNSGSKLGKQPDHRRAVLRSLVTNLLQHGRITTTLTRAKAARPVAEKIITLGKRDTLQSRRQAASYLRSEEHTSELQSQFHLVCRLLLEKKKKTKKKHTQKVTHKQ